MSEDLRKQIDWNALDEYWKDDYEATYGHLSNGKVMTTEISS